LVVYGSKIKEQTESTPKFQSELSRDCQPGLVIKKMTYNHAIRDAQHHMAGRVALAKLGATVAKRQEPVGRRSGADDNLITFPDVAMLTGAAKSY